MSLINLEIHLEMTLVVYVNLQCILAGSKPQKKLFCYGHSFTGVCVKNDTILHKIENYMQLFFNVIILII